MIVVKGRTMASDSRRILVSDELIMPDIKKIFRLDKDLSHMTSAIGFNEPSREKNVHDLSEALVGFTVSKIAVIPHILEWLNKGQGLITEKPDGLREFENAFARAAHHDLDMLYNALILTRDKQIIELNHEGMHPTCASYYAIGYGSLYAQALLPLMDARDVCKRTIAAFGYLGGPVQSEIV